MIRGPFRDCAEPFVANFVQRSERAREACCLAPQSIAGRNVGVSLWLTNANATSNPVRRKTGQETTGQQGQQSELGQQGGQSATGQAGTGSEPPRSMGTKGSEFGQFGDAMGSTGQQGQSGTGQSDLGSQSDTTLAGRSDQQDLGTDQPGSVGGASGVGTPGEGFIGSQGAGSDELIEREGPTAASSASATGGPDFATQGRGALEEEDDESGEGPKDVGSGGPGSSV